MQLSFFDHAMQYQGAKKSMKFLNEMKEIIPFENLVSILIEEGVYKPEVGLKGGRPQTSAKILLGALFLQSWYSLSDPMTEEFGTGEKSGTFCFIAACANLRRVPKLMKAYG